MLICCAYSPRTEREVLVGKELELRGINLAAGPWDTDNKEGLMGPDGMPGYRGLWAYYYTGVLLYVHDKNQKRIYIYDNHKKKVLIKEDTDGEPFTFNTFEEILDLEQRLCNGQGSHLYCLMFYKDFNQLLQSEFKNAHFLSYDPQGFFYSIDQTVQDLPKFYWTMDETFYEDFLKARRGEKSKISDEIRDKIKELGILTKMHLKTASQEEEMQDLRELIKFTGPKMMELNTVSRIAEKVIIELAKTTWARECLDTASVDCRPGSSSSLMFPDGQMEMSIDEKTDDISHKIQYQGLSGVDLEREVKELADMIARKTSLDGRAGSSST